jgi:hypothetical protein
VNDIFEICNTFNVNDLIKVMENLQTTYENENWRKQFSETEDYGMIAITDINDFNGEFAYEDLNTMNGASYLNYLRFHDDMI